MPEKKYVNIHKTTTIVYTKNTFYRVQKCAISIWIIYTKTSLKAPEDAFFSLVADPLV